MVLDKIAEYFLPRAMQRDKSHPRYDEFRVVASSVTLGIPFLALFPLLLLYFGKPVAGYYVNVGFLTLTLLSMKWLGHYRIPMSLTALVTYFIIYGFVKDDGLIFSSNMGIFHLYLLAAIWADKKWGWWAIFSNLIVFFYVYRQTHAAGHGARLSSVLGSPFYAFGVHCFISIFLGVFLAYEQLDQERNRKKIRDLQDQKISLLDEAVKKRTEQLNDMRQALATDFHDQTGNMLSAITRQASLLRLRLREDHDALPVVESIIGNSDQLYASSKDFLWNLNHNSDEPLELFDYLTAYGQLYYNQFDIAFSSETSGEPKPQQLEPFAALNLIYIFKEAMTNVVKHAHATEVVISMAWLDGRVVYALQDDGRWKSPDASQEHYGLAGIERRCEKNRFGLTISRQESGTRIAIGVPVYNSFI